MADLLAEVLRFRQWADERYPNEADRFGEWECDYEDWPDLSAAATDFFASRPFPSWSESELQASLYVLARDNEIEQVANSIRERHPELLVPLTRAALQFGERDARWQLAEQLGLLNTREQVVEELLVTLARDKDEYVRRRALQSLARLGSPGTEPLALEAWHRPDDDQEYSRMMALACLHQIGSAHFEPLRAEAERDERQYLATYAKGLRPGVAG